MEPRIQYATTSDGMSIAYWTIGAGFPLVHMPWPMFSHVELEWRLPTARRWYERLARGKQLVRYDGRGFGLSSRDVSSLSLDDAVHDLETVVDRLGLARFALWGQMLTAPAAILYSAKHPDRVSHLILFNAVPKGSLWTIPKQLQMSTEFLLDKDWELFTETVAHATQDWVADPHSHDQARVMRESVTPLWWRTIEAAYKQFDAMDMLAHVKAPALIIQNRAPGIIDSNAARELASGIPGAQIALVDMQSPTAMIPWRTDPEMLATLVNDFLGLPSSSPDLNEILESGMTAILFADIVNSTALTEKLGDTAFRDRARQLDEAMRTAIRDSRGTAIEGKLLGDGVLAVFTAARDAITAAIACRDASGDVGLKLHLGIHAGDVIREADSGGRSNVYGGAVNIASRISGLSAPGEILVSETVRSLARTSAGVSFEDRGEHSLKGIDDGVRVWAVRVNTRED